MKVPKAYGKNEFLRAEKYAIETKYEINIFERTTKPSYEGAVVDVASPHRGTENFRLNPPEQLVKYSYSDSSIIIITGPRLSFE